MRWRVEKWRAMAIIITLHGGDHSHDVNSSTSTNDAALGNSESSMDFQ